MELYWYIVVVVFIIIKIFFYVCWYRSTQRQLAAYLRTPRNAQIVIVGGRAYLHQMCERQGDDVSIEEASALPPAPSFSHLDMPPPYDAVSSEEELKPPPYSECACTDDAATSVNRDEGDSISISEAPPPYTPSPPRRVPQAGPQSVTLVPQPIAGSDSLS